VITTFTDTSISGPLGIVAGQDGALWFTNYTGNTIGRITTNGLVSVFGDLSVLQPDGIARGSDGALWFTNNGNNSIGRITVR
jgi:virginiamycin B lyase